MDNLTNEEINERIEAHEEEIQKIDDIHDELDETGRAMTSLAYNVGKSVPKKVYFDVPCKYCGAKPGEVCTTSDDAPASAPHKARKEIIEAYAFPHEQYVELVRGLHAFARYMTDRKYEDRNRRKNLENQCRELRAELEQRRKRTEEADALSFQNDARIKINAAFDRGHVQLSLHSMKGVSGLHKFSGDVAYLIELAEEAGATVEYGTFDNGTDKMPMTPFLMVPKPYRGF